MHPMQTTSLMPQLHVNAPPQPLLHLHHKPRSYLTFPTLLFPFLGLTS